MRIQRLLMLSVFICLLAVSPRCQEQEIAQENNLEQTNKIAGGWKDIVISENYKTNSTDPLYLVYTNLLEKVQPFNIASLDFTKVEEQVVNGMNYKINFSYKYDKEQQENQLSQSEDDEQTGQGYAQAFVLSYTPFVKITSFSLAYKNESSNLVNENNLSLINNSNNDITIKFLMEKNNEEKTGSLLLKFIPLINSLKMNIYMVMKIKENDQDNLEIRVAEELPTIEEIKNEIESKEINGESTAQETSENIAEETSEDTDEQTSENTDEETSENTDEENSEIDGESEDEETNKNTADEISEISEIDGDSAAQTSENTADEISQIDGESATEETSEIDIEGDDQETIESNRKNGFEEIIEEAKDADSNQNENDKTETESVTEQESTSKEQSDIEEGQSEKKEVNSVEIEQDNKDTDSDESEDDYEYPEESEDEEEYDDIAEDDVVQDNGEQKVSSNNLRNSK